MIDFKFLNQNIFNNSTAQYHIPLIKHRTLTGSYGIVRMKVSGFNKAILHGFY